TTLTDHLLWQLGAVSVRPEVQAAAELVIGNLNEDGYLTASEDELLGLARVEAVTVDTAATEREEIRQSQEAPVDESVEVESGEASPLHLVVAHTPSREAVEAGKRNAGSPVLQFSRDDLREAAQLVRQFDPIGVASRDLRECLLAQLDYLLKTRD